MIAKTEIIELDEFLIAGISVRTTNQNRQSQKDIGGLWTRFMNENLQLQIHNRTSDDIYCVYTDYETDHTGFYTAVLGCKVNSLTQIPADFVSLTIVPDKYQVYFLTGKFPENIAEAWRFIWDNITDRKYTADFDLYSANAKSFEETEVKIFLAVN
jgi:predicted transcriptional regulator YdeE